MLSRVATRPPRSNQFDPVLSVTTFVSRRFGLAGGLAVVALLASTEGNEILKSLTDQGPQPGDGVLVTAASGLTYKDVMVGTTGDGVGVQGSIVGVKAKVSIADKVLYDTASDKPIAFRYGKRPFENVLCEGVEQGVRGMKVGGVRELTVPASLAPQGLQEIVQKAGVPLTYTVEITEGAPRAAALCQRSPAAAGLPPRRPHVRNRLGSRVSSATRLFLRTSYAVHHRWTRHGHGAFACA